jgi:hypothetical protein
MAEPIRPEIWSKRIAAGVLPDLWRTLDEARAAAIARGVHWPGYVWMPFDEVSHKITMEVLRHLMSLGAPPETRASYAPFIAQNAYTLATWRLGKGIYRFDPDLRAALMDTPVSGPIPTDVLKRLPEWCVYVETPGAKSSDGRAVHGFFACIGEKDGEETLYLTIDMTDPLRTRRLGFIPIRLRFSTIEEALRANIADSVASTKEARRVGVPVDGKLVDEMRRVETNEDDACRSIEAVLADIGPLLSLVLYLCAEDRELDSPPPPLPQPVKTKLGPRFFAARETRLIGVGLRLGARLREARQRAGAVGGHGGTQLPHLRRAHWHTYLYGPRSGEQDRRLRWLHPILVNDGARSEDAPAVLHPVVSPDDSLPPA